MPALPAVPKVIRFVYGLGVGEDVNAVVLDHWQYTGTLSQADLATFIDDVRASWNTNIRPLQGTGDEYRFLRGTDLSTSTSPDYTNTNSEFGTRAGANLTGGVCLLQNNHSARRFRGGKYRQYWPLGVEADIFDQQTWAAAFLTAATAGLLAHETAIKAAATAAMGSVIKVGVSYYSGFTNVTGPTGRMRAKSTVRGAAQVDAITSFALNPNMATQRRRTLIRR